MKWRWERETRGYEEAIAEVQARIVNVFSEAEVSLPPNHSRMKELSVSLFLTASVHKYAALTI